MESVGGTATGEEPRASGDAGHRAIKKHFLKVSQAILRGNTVEHLYSEDLIGEEAMEVFLNIALTNISKARVIVRQVQASVLSNPSSFSTFLDVLKQEDANLDLAKTLEGSYI